MGPHDGLQVDKNDVTFRNWLHGMAGNRTDRIVRKFSRLGTVFMAALWTGARFQANSSCLENQRSQIWFQIKPNCLRVEEIRDFLRPHCDSGILKSPGPSELIRVLL